MKGIVAGVIAGIAGAVVWAVIVAVTGYEIGWLAWGIGAAVGGAVAWGSEGTSAMGVAAVIISVLAIVAGKYISVEMILSKEVNSAKDQVSQQVQEEEYLISWLADAAVTKIEESGGTVSWPEGVDPDETPLQEQYPAEIWSGAEQAWAQMTAEEKDGFKDDVRQQAHENITNYASSIKKDGFIASFGLFDAIFFFLAIGTAYKIGSKAD